MQEVKHKIILANIIGHVQGDGNISYRIGDKKYNKKYSYFRYFNKSLDLIGVVNKNIKLLFPEAYTYIHKRKDKPGNYYLCMASSKYTDLLVKFGGKSKDIPNWIIKSNKLIQSSYIKALFDDDGCVYFGKGKVREYYSIKKSISFANTLEKLVKNLKILLYNFDISSHIYKKGPRNTVFGRSKSIYELCILNNKSILNFYKKIGFDHPLKKEKLKKIIENKRIHWQPTKYINLECTECKKIFRIPMRNYRVRKKKAKNLYCSCSCSGKHNRKY